MRSLVLFAAACLAITTVAAEEKKVVCYFSTWAVYRQGGGHIEFEDIDANLCSHLIYAFVGLKGDNVKMLDSWLDLPDGGGKNGYNRFNALRQKNPKLKTMVAIGGWNEGSTEYSAMASNPSARSTFVKNAVNFVKKHGFNGLDVDWEYPAQRGGAANDVQNFSALLKELREAFDKEGLILSAAVGAAQVTASQSYNIAEISKYLHFINLMTYDLHTSNEPRTGHHASLFPAASEKGAERQLNVDAVVKYWLGQGADPAKLILGTGFYGKSFTLANDHNNRIGDAARSAGNAGPYTAESGTLGYKEICELQKKEQWTVEFDKERRVPYAFHGNQWVGYDDVQSIKEKAEYVKKMGLGGAMAWSIESDDFMGTCTGGQKFPLLKTLNHVLRNGQAVSEHPTQPRKPSQKATTEKPHVSKRPSHNGSGNGQCTKAGDIADPTTCSKFIKCVDQGNGQFQAVTFMCAPGLCFKPSVGVCDWA